MTVDEIEDAVNEMKVGNSTRLVCFGIAGRKVVWLISYFAVVNESVQCVFYYRCGTSELVWCVLPLFKWRVSRKNAVT